MIIQTAKWHHGHRRSDKSSARLLHFTTLIIGIIDCLVVSVRVSEALQQVGAGGHWRVSAGAVTAADQSFIVRLEEEGQRLTCAGVSYRGQQNSVELNDRTTPLFLVSNWISIIHDTLIKPTVCIDYCYSVVVHILPSFSELYFWPCCRTNTKLLHSQNETSANRPLNSPQRQTGRRSSAASGRRCWWGRLRGRWELWRIHLSGCAPAHSPVYLWRLILRLQPVTLFVRVRQRGGVTCRPSELWNSRVMLP